MLDPATITRVVGIDSSLTNTGLAVITADAAFVGHIPSSGHTHDDLATRAERIERVADTVAMWLDTGHLDRTLVLIEKPLNAQKQAGTVDIHWMWAAMVETALRFTPHVGQVNNATRSTWATGKGGADKAAVAHAIGRLYPAVDLASSDEADALTIAAIGAHRLGWLTDQPAYRTEQLSKVEWPEILTEQHLT